MAPAPATAKRPSQRKRIRKRKRRNLSSSSSSSEISSSSSSESDSQREPTTVKLPQKRPPAATKPTVPKAGDEYSSSSSDSDVDLQDQSSDSESESEQETSIPNPFSVPTQNATKSQTNDHDGDSVPQPSRRHRSPSPRIENVPEPPHLDGDKEKEEALRARFRQFWLGCVADAFADDLDEIRKEPNLTPARLSLLIDSLAAGADVYSSSSRSARASDADGTREQVNEMEIVLGE